MIRRTVQSPPDRTLPAGHRVGWFELFSKQAMSEHRPINQHQ
jgi:hypothetical protein